jgi:hypothetical protein
MRALFSAFPEVLLVDATHGTNTSFYKLFSFMVHGHGQQVQVHEASYDSEWICADIVQIVHEIVVHYLTCIMLWYYYCASMRLLLTRELKQCAWRFDNSRSAIPRGRT